MKILYVLNDTLKYGGTESVCLNYLNHIDKSKYQIDFLLHTTEVEMRNNEICTRLKKQGINIYYVTPRRISVKKNINELKNFFSNNKYDIVHSHADAASYIILKMAKKCGQKYLIAHCHSTSMQVAKTGIIGIMHRLYLNYCRFRLRSITKNYMACTEKAGIWLFGKNNVKNGNVYILKNAIDLKKYSFDCVVREKIRNELQLTDSLVIGHVGRFTFEKNHQFIINMIKDLSIMNSKYRLLLIGNGEKYNDIVKMAEQCEIIDSVIFLGSISDVYKYYNAMDFFVLPSKFEGLPVTLIEAQSNGLKCLVTDNANVSKKSRIVPDLVEFKRIDNSIIWAEYINNNINYDRGIDYTREITNSGYNIDVEIKKLEAYYDALLDK